MKKVLPLLVLLATPAYAQTPAPTAMHGDCTADPTSSVTCTKLNGVTISLGGPLTLSGSSSLTLTTIGNTTLTLPPSGTLATTTGIATGISAAIPSATTSQIYGGTGAAGTAGVINLGSGLSLSGGTLTATANTTSALPSATTSQLYGGTGAAGTAGVVSLGSGLTLSGGTLTASGGGSGLPSATTSQLYGGTGAAGTATPITLGSGLALSGGTLTSSGGGVAVGGPIDSNVSTSINSAVARTQASRATDQLSCKDFGCVGDGTLHTVSATLSVSTVAALQSYTATNGTHPYAFINTYNPTTTGTWQKYQVLQLEQAASSGATTLNFKTTVTASVAASSGGNGIVMAAGGLAGIHNGMTVISGGTGNGLTTATTVNGLNPQYTDGNNVEFFTTANFANAVAVNDTFTVTQNLAAVQAALTAGLTVHLDSPSIAQSTTVSSISAGVVTLSAATTGSISALDGVGFLIPYTDAEAAGLSMDTLGINAATYHQMVTNGGSVHVPSGTYVHNASLYFTPVGYGYTSGASYHSVDLVGEGQSASYNTWSTDLGTGQYAISCQFRLSIGSCGGVVRDMAFIGPLNHYAPGGASMSLMSGLGLSGRRKPERLDVEQFMSAFAITGDQTQFTDLNTFGNYYGMYWDYNNGYNQHDNHSLLRVVLGNNAMAAIGIGANYTLNGSTFTSVTDGAGPYGVMKETGGSSNTGLSSDKFTWFQCELVSVACVGEDRPYNSQVSQVDTTDFDFLEFQPAGGTTAFFNLPGGLGNATAAFSFGQGLHVSVRPADVFNWTPGVEGVMNVGNANAGITIKGDLTGLIANSGGKFFGPAASYQGWVFDGDQWKGHAIRNVGTFTTHVMACDIFSSNGTTQTSSFGNCAGAASDDPIGIVMQQSSLGNNIIILMTRGEVSTVSTGFTLSKVQPTGYVFWIYGPQSACTAAGGAIQPAEGRVCPNGGYLVGQMKDANNNIFELNIGVGAN